MHYVLLTSSVLLVLQSTCLVFAAIKTTPVNSDNCKGVRCQFKSGSNRCYVSMYNPKKPSDVQYLVNYNADNKVADWSIYFQPASVEWTKAQESVRAFKEHPCNQLKGFQHLTAYYDTLPKNPVATANGRHLALYQKGHLSPFAAFTFDQDQAVNTNFYINVAPQLGKLNGGDWSSLEEKVFNFIHDYSPFGGFVVTGTSRDVDGMPGYFWKMACAKMNDGSVVAGYFYHNNTLPKDFSKFDAAVDSYKAELRQPHSLTHFKMFMNDVDFNDIWEQAKALSDNSDRKNLADQCKTTLTLPGDDGCTEFPTFLRTKPPKCSLKPYSSK